MKKWPLRIIYYLTGFLVLSSIHCLIVGVMNGGSSKTFWETFIYLPAVILLSESQKKTKRFWQFGIYAMIAIVIPQIVYRGTFEETISIVLMIMASILYFYSRAKKIECPLETPVYQFILLYFVIWFMERQYPSKLLENYAIVGAGIYCLLCMYKINIDEILEIIDLNERLERFPEKRLLKSNLLMMGFQTVIVGTGMVLFMSTGADGLFDKLVVILRRFITWILSLLESDAGDMCSEMSDEKEHLFLIEPKETSAFMEFLLKLLDILSTIVVIGLMIYAIYIILKKIYELYLEFDMNSAENGDEIEKLYTVQSKEEKRKIKKKKKENLRWDRSPKAKIRKHYKKKILQDSKELPKAFMTPEEIEKSVDMSGDNKEVFHSLYERARYGNVDCSKDDVDKMLKT